MPNSFTKKLSEVNLSDLAEVGGKNASLGEMIQFLSKKDIKVPKGFVVTASAYQHFLNKTGLKDFIKDTLKNLKVKELDNLTRKAKAVREKIVESDFPEDLEQAILLSYKQIQKEYGSQSTFAVRSSATAEDLPGASFAGQHETFLNIKGEQNLLEAIKKAMASLFNDRAISYRADKGFNHFKISLSVGVQKMVRSDLACSGIMFTLDTETGFKDIVLINGSYGLGEMVVQGSVTPDEFVVFKKTLGKEKPSHPLKRLLKKSHFSPIISKKLGSKLEKMVYSDQSPTKVIQTTETERESFILSDEEILKLSKWAVEIEDHYTQKSGKWTPMDIEWAKDGQDGDLYIVQARPETIHSERDLYIIKQYERQGSGQILIKGASVGEKIVSGKVRIIMDVKDIGSFQKGEVLVTDITDPDWEPIMKLASAIVTDKGGRTSHAAIVSRELGIPAVVGCSDATKKLKNGTLITVDTTGSEGIIFEGEIKFKVIQKDVRKLPKTNTKIMINIATPQTAFEKSFYPNSGVGLAREEFIIASIGIHPIALINFKQLAPAIKNKVFKITKGYKNKLNYYIDHLAYGISRIGASFFPNPVIVRLSDFKTNEYRSLLGGQDYEPEEENPMIGWRGASRYYHPAFIEAFKLELKAIKKVRDEIGLKNIVVMVPFCRTVEEGRKVIEIMESSGLSRKKDPTLKIYVMCEIPSNVILAEKFLEVFDGMSIGSNDLTQLTLGIDRDGNERIKNISNENDDSVKDLIREVIKVCKSKNKYIGICGQAPTDYPEFSKFLVDAGIDSISLNPDALLETIPKIYSAEQQLNS